MKSWIMSLTEKHSFLWLISRMTIKLMPSMTPLYFFSSGPIGSSFIAETHVRKHGIVQCNSHKTTCHFQSVLFLRTPNWPFPYFQRVYLLPPPDGCIVAEFLPAQTSYKASATNSTSATSGTRKNDDFIYFVHEQWWDPEKFPVLRPNCVIFLWCQIST